MWLEGLNGFEVLGLVSDPTFATPASVSFDLSVVVDDYELLGPARPPVRVHHAVGRVDVHHPCNGHIKAKIRLALPARYCVPDAAEAIREKLFAHLGIPADETWEMTTFEPTATLSKVQYIDRNGMSDRIYGHSSTSVEGEA